MLNQIFENNGVNGTRTREVPLPGRCSLTQQRGSGRRLATARMKWNKEVKKTDTMIFTKVSFLIRREHLLWDTERIFREWTERGMSESTEQRVCDQARAIRKNGW